MNENKPETAADTEATIAAAKAVYAAARADLAMANKIFVKAQTDVWRANTARARAHGRAVAGEQNAFFDHSQAPVSQAYAAAYQKAQCSHANTKDDLSVARQVLVEAKRSFAAARATLKAAKRSCKQWWQFWK